MPLLKLIGNMRFEVVFVRSSRSLATVHPTLDHCICNLLLRHVGGNLDYFNTIFL